MSGLSDLTLAAARDGLRARKFSATELAQAHIARIGRHRSLNAFITETPERALAMAGDADTRLANGKGGLLEGVPLAIKDLFCTEGVLTTAGSLELRYATEVAGSGATLKRGTAGFLTRIA